MVTYLIIEFVDLNGLSIRKYIENTLICYVSQNEKDEKVLCFNVHFTYECINMIVIIIYLL